MEHEDKMIILELIGGVAVAAVIGVGAMYIWQWFQRAFAQQGEQSVNGQSNQSMGDAQPGEPNKTA